MIYLFLFQLKLVIKKTMALVAHHTFQLFPPYSNLAADDI